MLHLSAVAGGPYCLPVSTVVTGAYQTSSKLCFYLLKPRSLCSILSGHFCQELGQHLLHFFCPTGRVRQVGTWDPWLKCSHLDKCLLKQRNTKKLCVHTCRHHSRVRLFETLCTVARQACCHRDSPGKNTGMGCHVLFQGIFPTQGSNPISYISCIASRFFTTVEGPWNWFLLFCVFYLFIF